ncbi:ABC-type transport auxiliary lipoprotein family protein [Siccirubricoccus sp. KC 17139]|uniref:ABC-type transport auxiliary lipoprotein family protein n=1 Tax=Siccirubricoccus soli TaxID=2899147 RepID=A0ABT1D3N1_9PROT|nr:ABC-type transport auxiliary lipoprotein family protein [Siccirubricoccus soli]MCO6415885.1 ABC-type transport auxiliary lipoprotein family protein [Siccirubricoccus soli]MCP2682017.1 ABC-type transport auxiliary lipoprotein family protein [Siccirubricoccus soli]
MRRRALLALLALPGCSLLPERPYRPVQRFTLSPPLGAARPAPRRAPVLLVRTFRAAPGLEARGLRVLEADGQVVMEPWAEWVAPPADLAEEALRRQLTASGRFAAVTAPGSRLRADLVLEAELSGLEAVRAEGLARARLSGLLMTEAGEAGRVLDQFTVTGEAPLSGTGPAAEAAAMTAALGVALEQVEGRLATATATGRR